MSFLAPLFLLGGLAVALPVVFHLVRRSSRERMTFSSLMFLKPTPPRMTRRNRLEHLFLLMLRCLVICLLALGFARPFLQKPMAATPITDVGAQIVFLVDTSASMRREGIWEEALSRTEAALKRVGAADQVALLTFDDQVRRVVSFEQWAAMEAADRASLTAQRLAGHPPTWRATHLGNALIAAAETLEEAEKREQPLGARRIVLVSDVQEGSRLEGLQGHEWPRGLEVVIESVKAKRPTNAGLQWVTEVDDAERRTTEVVTRIRVSNSAEATREQFQVRWTGVPEGPSLDAYVPPGQSRIMPAPRLPEGVAADRLTLSGDDDAFDNTVHVVQPRAEEVNVLFLGEDPEKDPARLSYYLNRAFQDTRRQKVILHHVPGATPLPAPAPGTNRLVIVSGTLAADRAERVRPFVEGGGTVLHVMNDAASAATLGQLTGVTGVSAGEASVANYAMLGQVDFEHPLLAPFADPRFGDFTKIRFWKHRRLATDKLPAARVIARFDSEDPAILEIPAGRGRVFVFTFSWQPADSQFALSSKFVPVLYSILDLAAGSRTSPTRYTVGDPVDLAAFVAQSGARALSVRKPDGTATESTGGETRFTQTDQPGIYKVSGAETPVRFAVNLDAAESRTSPLPVGELERLGLPMQASAVDPTQQKNRQRMLHHTELEARQKLWRWLIVSALAVLLVETWLAGWLTRRAAARVEAAV